MSALKVIDEKYEIRDEIKRGGFGVIYQGVDLLFGKPVAIKAVEPSLLHEAKYIDMFQAEALSIARLNHHNIVHIYDIKRDADGQFYIVMEYIDGCDLSQLIQACRKTATPVPQHLGVYIVAEACAGLDYAHNRRDSETNDPLNVVHQDISPSNIMITRSGEVKIIDFGMAQFYRKQVLKKNEVSIQGKLNYLAPEQLNGATNIDRRTDIFALGLVLFEIITGERFFNADNPQKNIELLRSNKWDFSKIENQEVPKKLQEVIHKSLQAKTDDRYPSANHMYMDLMHFLILAAPAADFVGELSEFMQKIDAEKADKKEAESSELLSADNHPPVVEAPEESATRSNKTASRRGKKQRRKSRRNGARRTRKDAREATPGVSGKAEEKAQETTPDAAPTSEFMEISDKAVQEMDAVEEKANIEGELIAEKLQKPAEENAALQQEDEKAEKAASEPESATIEKERHENEKWPEKADSAPDLATESFDQADMAKILSQDDQVDVQIPDESVAESFESKQTRIPQKKSPSAEFYSILDDSEEEELKTIIDVVRLSARSHKKGVIVTLLSLVVLFIAYTVVDTVMQFTSYGTFIYDLVSPPAIKISSIPSGAQLYLDDKPLQQTTPVRIEKIDPGVHKLMLVLPRFEPIVKSINVPSEGKLQIAGEDNRNPWEDYIFQFKTQLELSSNPPDADIYINGVKLVQTTPATVLWDVAEEPIQITLAKPGFPNLTGVEINTLEGVEKIDDRRFWKFQRLDRTKDHFAIEGIFRKSVEIRSTPRKAEIYINDEDRPVGMTELNGTLLLPVGQHVITLRKSGYLPREFRITVDENTKSSYTQLLSRTVRVFAKDASSLDNSDFGAMLVELRTRRRTIQLNKETPTEITLLPYRYTAVLRKEGYEETFVQIAPADRTIVARMEPETAQLAVFIIDAGSNEPVNASQVLWKMRDSQLAEQQLGMTDASGTVVGELPPGNYQFIVIKPGYEVATKNLRIRADQRNRMTFKLSIKK